MFKQARIVGFQSQPRFLKKWATRSRASSWSGCDSLQQSGVVAVTPLRPNQHADCNSLGMHSLFPPRVETLITAARSGDAVGQALTMSEKLERDLLLQEVVDRNERDATEILGNVRRAHARIILV